MESPKLAPPRSPPTLKLALVGGGIFAKTSHVPALLQLNDTISVIAVWSHSKSSADSIASLFKTPVDVYFDSDSDGAKVEGRSYDDLLKRTDIDAVDIVVPIDTLPEFVEKALSCGKHVISEKPMAPSVEIGKKLLHDYANHLKKYPDLVWAIAEQIFYEPVWNLLLQHKESRERHQRRASRDLQSEESPRHRSASFSSASDNEASSTPQESHVSPSNHSVPATQVTKTVVHDLDSILDGSSSSGSLSSSALSSSSNPSIKKTKFSLIGEPIIATLTRYVAMNTENKYYSTKWRCEPAYQGGYLLDGGVHEIAKLRMALGEVEEVTCVAKQFRPDLPPLDTLIANLKFKSGVLCNFTLTFTAVSQAVANSSVAHEFTLSGSAGALFASRDELVLMTDSESKPGEVQRQVTHVENEQGRLSIKRELLTFALTALKRPAIGKGVYTPREGLQDVAVIQALLESAKTNKTVQVETIRDPNAPRKRSMSRKSPNKAGSYDPPQVQ